MPVCERPCYGIRHGERAVRMTQRRQALSQLRLEAGTAELAKSGLAVEQARVDRWLIRARV